MTSIYEKYNLFAFEQSKIVPEKWSFKSNKIYTQILEHTNLSQGKLYLKYILKEFPDIYSKNKNTILNLIDINDRYGKTNKYKISDLIYCGPSNLRYIYQSFKILSYMNKLQISDIDIIEIGGGYGGLSFYLHNLSPIFDITIKTYTIFDLNGPNKLTNAYLSTHNISTNNYTLDNFDNLKKNSFMISNYAFSELPENIRKDYENKIIDNYILHGFLAWNAINYYNVKKDKKYTLLDTFYSIELNHQIHKYLVF